MRRTGVEITRAGDQREADGVEITRAGDRRGGPGMRSLGAALVMALVVAFALAGAGALVGVLAVPCLGAPRSTRPVYKPGHPPLPERLARDLRAQIEADFGPGRHAYVPPTPEERERLQAMVADLVAAMGTDREGDASMRLRDDARGMGLQLTSLTSSLGPMLLLHERRDPPRGWGLLLLRADHRWEERRLIIEVPHPVSGARSEDLGARIFQAVDADALLMAGTARDCGAGPPGGAGAAQGAGAGSPGGAGAAREASAGSPGGAGAAREASAGSPGGAGLSDVSLAVGTPFQACHAGVTGCACPVVVQVDALDAVGRSAEDVQVVLSVAGAQEVAEARSAGSTAAREGAGRSGTGTQGLAARLQAELAQEGLRSTVVRLPQGASVQGRDLAARGLLPPAGGGGFIHVAVAASVLGSNRAQGLVAAMERTFGKRRPQE